MGGVTKSESLPAQGSNLLDWPIWAAIPKLVTLNLGVSIIAGAALFLINATLTPAHVERQTKGRAHGAEELLHEENQLDPNSPTSGRQKGRIGHAAPNPSQQ